MAIFDIHDSGAEGIFATGGVQIKQPSGLLFLSFWLAFFAAAGGVAKMVEWFAN